MMDIIEVPPFILGFPSRVALLQPKDIWLYLSLERAVCPVSRIFPALFVYRWLWFKHNHLQPATKKEYLQSKTQRGSQEQQCTCFSLCRCLEMETRRRLMVLFHSAVMSCKTFAPCAELRPLLLRVITSSCCRQDCVSGRERERGSARGKEGSYNCHCPAQ